METAEQTETKIKAEEERERMSPEEWEERQAKSMKVHNRQFPSTVSVKPWRVESLDERIEGNPEFLENAVSFQVYQSGGGGTNWIIEDFKDGIVEDGVPESVVDAVADRAKSMLDDMKAESLAGWVRLLKACNAGRTGKDVRNRVTVVLNVVVGNRREDAAKELQVSVHQIDTITRQIEAYIGQSLRK